MTNEEALQLAKQGFTADEIRALGWSTEGSYNEPKIGGDDNPKGTPETDDILGEPEAGTRELPKALIDRMDAMSNTIETLTDTVKAMQEANQKTAKKSKNDNAPKSADEVIKGFIENM